ncbi:MAG: rhodanese-like domain-containing protein, partial [Aureliella sp.]
MHTINVRQLASIQVKQKVELIDVRMPTEYREVHAVGAVNVPLGTLDPKAVAASCQRGSDQPLYVICKSGNRSTKAVQKFLDAGMDNVVNVEGGTTAWVAADLPVIRGKKSISLERQVRIAAGSIALIGSLATMVTGNVAFAGIPAFIGAGLA